MSATEPVVTTRGLTKSYRDVIAVREVDLHIRAGEIYALLGLNGAGKTTLIRMLLGMVRPTSGSMTVLGRAVRSVAPRLWTDVGYLVETSSAYPDLTVEENLDLVRRLRHLSESAVSDVIERLTLAPYRRRLARELSLGNAQRLGLAKALIHRPRLLILDEPINGLDPAGVAEIRELLLELAREQGVTVLLSSHILTEVARLAARIGVIHQGVLVQELDAADLPAQLHGSLLVSTRDRDGGAAALRAAGYTITETGEPGFVLEHPDAIGHPDDVATVLVRAGCPPTHLSVETEDLETYFLRLVGAERSSS